MKILNLFGDLVDAETPKHQSPYQKMKAERQYRKSTDEIKCKNCKYHLTFDYHNKHYHKCKLIGVSHSEATDIRVSFVCNVWEKECTE